MILGGRGYPGLLVRPQGEGQPSSSEQISCFSINSIAGKHGRGVTGWTGVKGKCANDMPGLGGGKWDGKTGWILLPPGAPENHLLLPGASIQLSRAAPLHMVTVTHTKPVNGP